MTVEVEGCNRYLVVDLVDENEEEKEAASLVLLPDEFEEPKSNYAIGKVKSSNITDWNVGDVIAFPRAVLQEVTFRGNTTYLVQENYIVCIFFGEE